MRTSALFKLIGICAFLCVQALQLDHNVDQYAGDTHTDCMVCKSSGDPTPSADNIIILDNIAYSEQLGIINKDAAPRQPSFNIQLVRGPPTLS